MKHLLLTLALLPVFASAQTLTPAQSSSAFGSFMSVVTGAGQQTVSFGTGGTPLASPTSATLSTSGGANVSVAQSGSVRMSSGVSVPVSATSSIPVSRFKPVLKKALGVLPIVGNGLALWALAMELGFEVSKPSEAAPLTVVKTTLNIGYRIYPHPVRSSALLACKDISAFYDGIQVLSVQPTQTLIRCKYSVNGGYGDYWQTTSNLGTTSAPSTVDALVDEIAATSGWPSTSAVSRAIAEALPLSGLQVAPEPLTITGPALTPVSEDTVTTPTPTGSKETKTKKDISCTYGLGGSLTCEELTKVTEKTTTVDPVTGTPTVSPEITTSETKTKEKPAEKPLTDCQINPNSSMCAELGTPPTSDLLNKTTKAVSVVSQSFSGGGACPSALGFSVIGRSYSISYQPLCDRLYILRTLFIALGGFIAAFILADSFKV